MTRLREFEAGWNKGVRDAITEERGVEVDKSNDFQLGVTAGIHEALDAATKLAASAADEYPGPARDAWEHWHPANLKRIFGDEGYREVLVQEVLAK